MDDNFDDRGKFKAGNRAGAGHGRPRIGRNLRELPTLSKDEFKRVLNKYINWSVSDLKDFCDDWANPAIDILVCRVLLSAIKDGDHVKLNYIASSIIGRKALEEMADSEDDENIHRKIVTVINQIEQKGHDNGDKKSSEEKSQDNEKEEVK